jgi:hypothetical protein
MFQFRRPLFAPVGLEILPLIGTLAGLVAQAGQGQYRVVVSERDSAGVPNPARYQAEGLATQMFAGIGVVSEWPSADLGTPTSIVVERARNAGGERKCDPRF